MSVQSRFFTTEKLGPTRDWTPEGFLVCKDVPIARTGLMIYHPTEVQGIDAGPDGLIRAQRNEADVFHPDVLSSFEGKPVTIQHPQDRVTPDNWRDLAVGEVTHVRRGENAHSDCVVADLLIKRRDGIDAILRGMREVSCGYDVKYEQLEPGIARQFDIIGNHVALVERGRCGPQCAIGDAAPMTTKAPTLRERIASASAVGDSAALSLALDELTRLETGTASPTGGMVINIGGQRARDAEEETEEEKKKRMEKEKEGKADDKVAAFDTRLGKLEDTVGKIATSVDKLVKVKDDEGTGGTGTEEKPGDSTVEISETEAQSEAAKGAEEITIGDAKVLRIMRDGKAVYARVKKAQKAGDGMAKDSTSLAVEFTEMTGRAEILAPGVRLMTFDAAQRFERTIDGMCSFRRRAIDAALLGPHKESVARVVAGRNLDVLPCADLKTVFDASAEIVRQRNQASGKPAALTPIGTTTNDAQNRLRAINERQRKFYGQTPRT